MSDFTLPFPNRELADKELSYDYCYNKIPEEDRGKIVEMAWQKGVKAARATFEKFGGSYDFFKIVKDSGLKCFRRDKDYVSGNNRYFSDYLTGRNEISLYMKSIALWAKQNDLSVEEAANLILSHEYFHYLEHSELGFTSREYQVPMIIVGPFKIGSTGIRALSEIGAHAFAHTYYQLAENHKNGGQTNEQL